MSMTDNEAREEMARTMLETHHRLAKERISAAVAEILKDLRLHPTEAPPWHIEIEVSGRYYPTVMKIDSVSGIEGLEVKIFGD